MCIFYNNKDGEEFKMDDSWLMICGNNGNKLYGSNLMIDKVDIKVIDIVEFFLGFVIGGFIIDS